MDDNEIMQGAEETGDGFLEGWEETSPNPEELDEDGENQAAQEIAGGESAADAPEAADGDQVGSGEQEEGQGQGQEVSGDQAAQEAPRTWTLNHLGQAVTANEADMVVLAQKGLDYDRIRSEYEEAKPVMAMFRDFAEKAGMSVGDYLSHIRAQAKQAEGLSEAEARRAVELEDREAVVAAQEQARQQQETAAQQAEAQRQQAEARRQADVREFIETFPDAARDPQSIPQEVWEEVRGGRSLVAAYARYSAEQARVAAEEAQRTEQARQQNAVNAARSAGSMRSAGAGNGARDPFLEGWEE